MKRVRTGASLWAIGAVAVLTLLTLTVATYAWFSSNREVETSRVTARTGSDKLELQISSLGGDAFRPMQDASGENNEVTLRAQENPLLPVSTADLAGFVYAPFTVDGRAENFLPATDETRYYHETIYLRAVGTGMPEGTRIALYLDNPGEPLVQDTDGTLLTAARLGLTFDGANPVIFRLSDVDEGAGNSSPGGTPLEAGKVLTLQGGQVVSAEDPAIPLEDRQITDAGAAGRTPLTYLELNRICAVDLYFYLEGCDPDCLVERVGLDQAVFQLAFFGIVANEEVGP